MYQFCENKTLRENGFQVIENVIDNDFIKNLKKDMWEWLNFKTKNLSKPIVEEDESSYKSFFELYPKHGMLLQHWDSGHNPMSWKLRQDKNIIKIFSDIWNTKNLLTSFDGLSISLPPEITNRGWNQSKTWFHSDQCFKRNNFECVQALINLYDVNEGDATLRVLDKSHLLHKDFQDQFQIQSNDDWLKLNEVQKNFYLKKLGKGSDICIKAKKGSMFLWDSRTIHQGYEPLKDRSKKNIRCALYICMVPADNIDQLQLKKRIKYFEEKRTTNHYPKKVKPFSIIPRTYGGIIPKVEYNEIEKNEMIRDLVGYKYLK